MMTSECSISSMKSVSDPFNYMRNSFSSSVDNNCGSLESSLNSATINASISSCNKINSDNSPFDHSNIPPSDRPHDDGQNVATRVLLLRNLSRGVTEIDVEEFVKPFTKGHRPKIYLQASARRAFVEFIDENAAKSALQYFLLHPIQLKGSPVHATFSKRDCVVTLHENINNLNDTFRVLLASVTNLFYPVDINLIHYLFSKYGTIEKIITFSKNPTMYQALIQFKWPEEAKNALCALHNKNIYDGYNTLQIQPSKLNELIIRSNSNRSFDYTLGESAHSISPTIQDNNFPDLIDSNDLSGRSDKCPKAEDGLMETCFPPVTKNGNSVTKKKNGGFLRSDNNIFDVERSRNRKKNDQNHSSAPRVSGIRMGFGGNNVTNSLPSSVNLSTHYNQTRNSGDMISNVLNDYNQKSYRNGTYLNSKGREHYVRLSDNNFSINNNIRKQHHNFNLVSPAFHKFAINYNLNGTNDRSRNPDYRMNIPSISNILHIFEKLPREIREIQIENYNKKQTPVIICYNLPQNDVNVTKLFNLFSLYGAVLRIKILREKDDTALIQYSDPFYASLAYKFLQNAELLDKELQISFSKNHEVRIPMSSITTGNQINYTNDNDDSNNPISESEVYSKTRSFLLSDQRYGQGDDVEKYIKGACRPTCTLFIANVHEDVTKKDLQGAFSYYGVVRKISFKMSNRGSDTQMAMIEMESEANALLALMNLHNYVLIDKAIKVAFSKTVLT